MKTLIISDIHGDFESAESIIAKVKPNRTLFLGDYFDSFDPVLDNLNHVEKTALWLRESLNRKDRIHLMGNHDQVYFAPSKYTLCSGYTDAKERVINSVLNRENWLKLKWFYNIWDDKNKLNHLFTHAGLTDSLFNAFFDNTKDLGPQLQKHAIEATKCLLNQQFHWFYAIGRERGGLSESGGLTWCDINGFYPTKNVNQIFGHTPMIVPKSIVDYKTYNLCMDNFLRSYFVFNNQNVLGGKLYYYDEVYNMKNIKYIGNPTLKHNFENSISRS